MPVGLGLAILAVLVFMFGETCMSLTKSVVHKGSIAVSRSKKLMGTGRGTLRLLVVQAENLE